MTWFRRDESIHWFHPDETEAIKKLIEKEIILHIPGVWLSAARRPCP